MKVPVLIPKVFNFPLTYESGIYKSLNAATILVNIMLEQNNVSSNNPIKQPQMIRKKTNQTTNK